MGMRTAVLACAMALGHTGVGRPEPVPLDVALPFLDQPSPPGITDYRIIQKPPYLGKHDGWTDIRPDQDPGHLSPQQAHLVQILTPQPFLDAKDRERGWVVDLGTKRPVPTPAYHKGKLYVSGGFATHSVMCFSSITGTAEWHYRTRDIGPSAPVVNDEALVVNTESCEVEVLSPAGRPVWKRWLGDPLMAMPTLDGNTVFACYPANEKQRHILAAFDAKNGNTLWQMPVEGDVISAPVVHDGFVYVSTLNGKTQRFRRGDGEVFWAENCGATSAPRVAGDRSYFTIRKKASGDSGEEILEGLAWRGLAGDGAVAEIAGSFRPAPYLDEFKRMDSPLQDLYRMLDSRAGFATAPPMAKIAQAQANLAQSTVMGIFSYQGAIGSLDDGRLFATLGDEVAAYELPGGRKLWKRTLPAVPRALESERRGTPPVSVNGKVFLGTVAGTFHCLRATDGKELWRVDVGAPMRAQPVIAAGHAYIPTEDGRVFAIRTGDPADSGWMMWGGSPGHDGALP